MSRSTRSTKPSRTLERATYIEPMKALGIDAVPSTGEDTWRCEIKFDGYRSIAVLNGGKARLWSRNRKPMDYPELLKPLQALKCSSAVLDGEIVAVDSLGRSNFQRLQGREVGERPVIAYYLFDLLYLNGKSLLNEPIERRQEKLAGLFGHAVRPLLLSPVYDVAPDVLFAKARELGLEGILLKRRGSTYEAGRRSGAWLKIKHVAEQEFVIGGFTPPQRSRQHFGAILVGYYQGRKLRYAGKVGTGFDAKLLSHLRARFEKLKSRQNPFEQMEDADARELRKVTWIKPALVAQVKFAEWTQEGLLRQPVFLGLRGDKAATAVRREAAAVA